MIERSASRRRAAPEQIDAAIDAALAEALRGDPAVTPMREGTRLGRLFADLARPQPRSGAREIEALIWALWSNHDDPALDGMMAAAIDALVERRHRRARAVLDRLVAAAPDWAEAWNKRATLAFVEGRDVDCLADIARTLAREPRHFGAAAGLGQICLRQDRPREAHAAFDVALRINPHMEGVSKAAAELRGQMRAGDLN
jgi:predicted Zn-dependent protease